MRMTKFGFGDAPHDISEPREKMMVLKADSHHQAAAKMDPFWD